MVIFLLGKLKINGISPYIGEITAEMTISQLDQKLRKSLIEKINNKQQFSNSRGYNQSLPKMKGIFTEFTNIGPFHIKM